MKKCKLIINGNVYTTNATLPSCEIEETKNVDGKHKWNPISFDEITPSIYGQIISLDNIIIIYDINEIYKLSKTCVDIVYKKIEFTYATIL